MPPSLAIVSIAQATERKFAFTYETTTAAKGTVEFENWVTWKHSDNAAEVLHEVEFPDWGEAEEARVWAGPNISLRAGPVSAVLAGLFQLTDVDEEPEVLTRLIFGVTF